MFKDGSKGLYRKPLEYLISNNDEVHTVREGETLLTIAFDKYGDDRLWYVLADINPHIEDIFELKEGLKILIPNYDIINSRTSG